MLQFFNRLGLFFSLFQRICKVCYRLGCDGKDSLAGGRWENLQRDNASVAGLRRWRLDRSRPGQTTWQAGDDNPSQRVRVPTPGEALRQLLQKHHRQFSTSSGINNKHFHHIEELGKFMFCFVDISMGYCVAEWKRVSPTELIFSINYYVLL